MPLLETKGAASSQGFGLTLGGVERVFIEDVFSTFLYTGNGSTQTITNGIDLAGKGGLVWCKPRSVSGSHSLTYRPAGYSGSGSWLKTDSSDGSPGSMNRSYSATGFSTSGTFVDSNNGDTFASWTFRNQPKFFTAVEYTGNGSNRTIAHDLGSVPGCIIVKRLDFTPASDWQVYHRSLANTEYLVLNSTAAVATGATRWNSTTPTSTVFSLGTDTTVNANGGTYVAYLFAHDAGGFGLSGTDNVISCGSFTTDGSGNADINLGYEAQYVMLKGSQYVSNWYVEDNMRGLNLTQSAILQPNSSAAEVNGTATVRATATGFATINGQLANSATYIYIAIRRGPMKTPTSGTSVYNAIARTGTGATATVSGFGFPLDTFLSQTRSTSTSNAFIDRLRGGDLGLSTQGTAGESTGNGIQLDRMDGYVVPNAFNPFNNNGTTVINWGLRRAPGFFDVVCYTADSVNGRSISHNLTVVPELAIFKSRGATSQWYIWHSSFTLSQEIYFTTAAVSVGGIFTSAPTATNIFASSGNINFSSFGNVVAYLFASCPGVSKVFSYTGNGSSQTINCGFTAGARFVLIKRTDSTGDWYVWDSARGIVAANDPHLSLNTTAAEVTTDDSVDTDNTGFIVNQVAATNINVSSASYIGLAVA